MPTDSMQNERNLDKQLGDMDLQSAGRGALSFTLHLDLTMTATLTLSVPVLSYFATTRVLEIFPPI